MDNVETALAALTATGASVVMTNVPDYGATPLAPLLYSVPERRQLVTQVIATINSRLAELAAVYRAVLVDLFGFDRAFRGTSAASVKWQTIGGVAIFSSGGPDPDFAFLADGVHPGTVYQALTANLLLEGFRLGYGTAVDDYRFTEEQMLLEAGLTYGGEDTFTLEYAGYVVLPTANRLPVANADGYSLDENTTLTTTSASGVAANDGDPNGDLPAAVLVSGPAHGTLRLKADGSFRYAPAANYHGPDSFIYKANDGRADSNTATVTLSVNAVNDPPTAHAQALKIAEDGTPAIVLSGDDGDPEDVQKLTFAIVAGPSHGKLSGFDAASGRATYTPDKDYNGPDGFTFTVTDDDAAGSPPDRTSPPATASITITPINDAPIACDDSVTTDEDRAVAIALAAGDGDPEVVQQLTYAVTAGPSHGKLSGFDPATGRGIYTPDPQYHGPDAIRFTVTDDATAGTPASLTSAEAALSITIRPVNDPPAACPQTIFVDWNAAAALTLAGDDGDPEVEQKLSFTIVGGPSRGKLSGLDAATGRVTYTPDPDFHGADSFSLR